MNTTPDRPQTDKVSVELTLTDGTSMRVKLFVRDMERVNDLLNDSRKFIPFEDVSGQIRLVNKAHILTVIPTDDGQRPPGQI